MKENDKNEKKECVLVRDLLPNYIDKLTSSETNLFIEKHLERCSECKSSYKKMNANINLDEEYERPKKVKIFKKINREIKLLQIILFAMLIIFGIRIISKYLILCNIENLAEKTNYSNYYEKIVETTDKYISKIEYYQSGDNFFSINTKISSNNKVEKYIECLDRRQVGQFIQRKAFLPFAVCQGNELFYTKISFLQQTYVM